MSTLLITNAQMCFVTFSSHITVILTMNLVLDRAQHQGPPLALAPAPLAAAANQEAVTQVVAQTLAASQILTQRNPRRRWNSQISQTSMELR